MPIDPDTTYHRDNDGVLRPVPASKIVWSPIFETAHDRLNATLARRIAACRTESRNCWYLGELTRMLVCNRRCRTLQAILISRLPEGCRPNRRAA